MRSQTRVVGSNYTTLTWRGRNVAFLEGFSDSGVQPVAAVEEIHPLGEDHPIEFAVPRALSGGTLGFTIRELWAKPVWQHLEGLAEAQNILDVWDIFNASSTENVVTQIIKIPGSNTWRKKTYHNVVISAIDDSERVSIGAMTIAREIRARYTHSVRGTVTASS